MHSVAKESHEGAQVLARLKGVERPTPNCVVPATCIVGTLTTSLLVLARLVARLVALLKVLLQLILLLVLVRVLPGALFVLVVLVRQDALLSLPACHSQCAIHHGAVASSVARSSRLDRLRFSSSSTCRRCLCLGCELV